MRRAMRDLRIGLPKPARQAETQDDAVPEADLEVSDTAVENGRVEDVTDEVLRGHEAHRRTPEDSRPRNEPQGPSPSQSSSSTAGDAAGVAS